MNRPFDLHRLSVRPLEDGFTDDHISIQGASGVKEFSEPIARDSIAHGRDVDVVGGELSHARVPRSVQARGMGAEAQAWMMEGSAQDAFGEVGGKAVHNHHLVGQI